MESDGRTTGVTAETVASLALAAGLPLEPTRLEALAEALSVALEATRRLEEPASRVTLAESLDFDPSWTKGGRPS